MLCAVTILVYFVPVPVALSSGESWVYIAQQKYFEVVVRGAETSCIARPHSTDVSVVEGASHLQTPTFHVHGE